MAAPQQAAVPDQIIKIGEKCYLGGKGIDNSGGNISDYLFATASTRNIVIIEIKTPRTPLIGKRYRANAYAISEELSGAIVQTLSYRDELLKSYYNLTGRPYAAPFAGFRNRPDDLYLFQGCVSKCNMRALPLLFVSLPLPLSLFL
jgi:hypothetical protein